MKHPKDIAAGHPQTESGSCIAWATEMILLTFEKPLPSPPLQRRQGVFGYAEAMTELTNAGISFYEKSFAKDFGEFERASLKAIRSGVFPVVMLPSYYFYHWESKGMMTMNHAYMVFEENGVVKFVTWAQGEHSPRYVTREGFEDMRYQWTDSIEKLRRPTDHLMHTLFPTAPSTPMPMDIAEKKVKS